jgi:hypothetical protein
VHFKAIIGDLTLVAKARRTSGRDLMSTPVIDRPAFQGGERVTIRADILVIPLRKVEHNEHS